MKNKKGQIRNGEDFFKALLSVIFGIIFLGALKPLVTDLVVLKTFIDVGIILMIVGAVMFVISLFVPNRRR